MSATDFLTTQGLPDGELLGAVAMVLIPVGIAYAIAAIRDRRRRTAASTPAPAAVRAVCDVTGCRYTACEWRIQPQKTGPAYLRHVCKGCANEGDAYGWWRPTRPVRDELPFDQDANALVIELEQWRKAGGAA